MAERRSRSRAAPASRRRSSSNRCRSSEQGLALLVDSFPGCSVLARVGEPEDAIETIARTRRQRVTALVSIDAPADGHDAYSLIRRSS